MLACQDCVDGAPVRGKSNGCACYKRNRYFYAVRSVPRLEDAQYLFLVALGSCPVGREARLRFGIDFR